jgi:hypothetical protein
MHYEHKVLSATTPINEEQLDTLSNEGWELITIIEWQGAFYFYFKRLAD